MAPLDSFFTSGYVSPQRKYKVKYRAQASDMRRSPDWMEKFMELTKRSKKTIAERIFYRGVVNEQNRRKK